MQDETYVHVWFCFEEVIPAALGSTTGIARPHRDDGAATPSQDCMRVFDTGCSGCLAFENPEFCKTQAMRLTG